MFAHILRLIVVLLFTHAFAQSTDDPKRLEGTFTLLRPTSSECPSELTHEIVASYNGLGTAEPRIALLWKNLLVGSEVCTSLDSNLTTTVFSFPEQDAPDTPASQAEPFFATGEDRRPRLCSNFMAPRRAAYWLTDDMPRFKQRFITNNLFPASGLPAQLEDPKRGDVYMFSQQFDEGVRSTTVCVYWGGKVNVSEPRPREEEADDDPVCFPGDGRVSVEGKTVAMRDVKIGDMVRTGEGMGRVVSFSHRDEGARARFVRVTVDGGGRMWNMSASAGHLIYAPTLRAMGTVRVGDVVRVVGGVGKVVEVSEWEGRGVYSPVTSDGMVVVDGVVASCYTTAVHWRTAHAALSVARLGFGDWCSVIDGLRWALLMWRR